MSRAEQQHELHKLKLLVSGLRLRSEQDKAARQEAVRIIDRLLED